MKLAFLHEQHAVDLAIYRSAHEHSWNRRLHYVLIPLEVASFLWLITSTVMAMLLLPPPAATTTSRPWARSNPDKNTTRNVKKNLHCSTSTASLMVSSLGWTMGLLSASVASDWRLGLVILLLHVTWVHLVCLVHIPRLGFGASVRMGLVVWTLSWGLQIGVGHYWIEQKPPNLFNPNDQVSLLSTVTSIVLAWEC